MVAYHIVYKENMKTTRMKGDFFMKKKNIISVAGVLALALVCGSAFFMVDSAQAAEANIKFSKSTKLMEQGSTSVFTVKTQNTNSESVAWKSSNPKVLKVNANGKVKAKAAGEAVITASAGKVSVTKKVTVYPSLEQISIDNHIADNLAKNTYSSISMKDQGIGYELLEVISKKENGYVKIASGSSLQVFTGNLEYDYDCKTGMVSIFAAENLTEENPGTAYTAFSNERITDISVEAGRYLLTTESDIAGMTQEEQKDKVGISDGIIQKELVIDKKTGLLQEYGYTILFDKEDPDYKHVSRLVFSYDEDHASEFIPEAVKLVMNAEKTRAVTIISKPGTASEEKVVYTIPASMPLYIAGKTTYYKDAACTEEFTQAKKNIDGTYDSYTLYIK